MLRQKETREKERVRERDRVGKREREGQRGYFRMETGEIERDSERKIQGAEGKVRQTAQKASTERMTVCV